jgi:tRNA threonylcarbamoyladenosine biosynthesis protein TsaB
MREVYWGCATRGASGLAESAGPERVGPPDTVQLPLQLPLPPPVHGAGRGFTLWPSLQQRLGADLSQIHAQLLPRAREVARLAVPQWQAGQGLTAEHAQPVYLRDDVAKPSRK